MRLKSNFNEVNDPILQRQDKYVNKIFKNLLKIKIKINFYV
jgi:hypothetical protein